MLAKVVYNSAWTLGAPEPCFAQEGTIKKHTVLFKPGDKRVEVPSGSLIEDAALEAGVEINMPCGGQGRCGRCAVIVEEGKVRRRSTLRLSAQEVEEGWALTCQTVIESDLVVTIPPQEAIERRIPTAKVAAKIALPFPYDWREAQAIQNYFVSVGPPSLEDNTDDFSRLKRALTKQHGIRGLVADLPLLRKVGAVLRQADWQVTAVVELYTWASPKGPPRLVDILPGNETATSWGVAVDIGTTSNVVYLVDLLSGEVRDMATDYNGQIARGEDIISRIIYASQDDGLRELQGLVMGTINKLLRRVCGRQGIKSIEIYKMVAAGNSTMIHLFLAIPPESIRLEPYVTATNHPLPVKAREIGIDINPQATIDCLPGVGSYMGADITAGVMSSGLCESKRLTLFMDIGTNGEIVLGDCDWLISCACSAGPAFEGAGVEHGMRATAGAIEEVWINGQTLEPTYRVIGNEAPRGLCGSALISLLAEMFITVIVDKRGRVCKDLDTRRVREGEHGWEYVVAWGTETAHGQDIAITQVDIENLIRAKAAIHAGYSVLSKSLDVDISQVEEFLIAGAFGQYLNVERAIQIGLLPDMPWEKFKFLGNTSVRGAYMALLSRQARQKVAEIAQMMTYMELSADDRFTQEFVSALFLPHTQIEEYPSVMALLEEQEG